jgi:DNA-binding transcriptional MerR regulator
MDRTYSTFEVMHLAGITERKLQWWREHRLVRCHQNGHNLRYSKVEAATVCVITVLRGKGMTLSGIRRLLPTIRSEIASCWAAGDKTVLAVEANKSIRFHLSNEKAIARAVEEKQVRIVDVGEILRRVEGFSVDKERLNRETMVRRHLDDGAGRYTTAGGAYGADGCLERITGRNGPGADGREAPQLAIDHLPNPHL